MLQIRFLGLREPRRQYHLPRANPPKATSPIKAMIRPSKKLQTIITTIPMITMMPPVEIPPIPPRRCSGVATRPSLLVLLVYPLTRSENRVCVRERSSSRSMGLAGARDSRSG